MAKKEDYEVAEPEGSAADVAALKEGEGRKSGLAEGLPDDANPSTEGSSVTSRLVAQTVRGMEREASEPDPDMESAPDPVKGYTPVQIERRMGIPPRPKGLPSDIIPRYAGEVVAQRSQAEAKRKGEVSPLVAYNVNSVAHNITPDIMAGPRHPDDPEPIPGNWVRIPESARLGSSQFTEFKSVGGKVVPNEEPTVLTSANDPIETQSRRKAAEAGRVWNVTSSVGAGALKTPEEIKEGARARQVAGVLAGRTEAEVNPFVRSGAPRKINGKMYTPDSLSSAWELEDALEADEKRPAISKPSGGTGRAGRSAPVPATAQPPQAEPAESVSNMELPTTGLMGGRLPAGFAGKPQGTKDTAVRIQQFVEDPESSSRESNDILSQYFTETGAVRPAVTTNEGLRAGLGVPLSTRPFATSAGEDVDTGDMDPAEVPASVRRRRMSGQEIVGISRETGTPLESMISRNPEYEGKVSDPQRTAEALRDVAEPSDTARRAAGLTEAEEESQDAIFRMMKDVGAPRKGAAAGTSNIPGVVEVRKKRSMPSATPPRADVETSQAQGEDLEAMQRSVMERESLGGTKDQAAARALASRIADRSIAGRAGIEPLAGPGGGQSVGGRAPAVPRTAEERRSGGRRQQ